MSSKRNLLSILVVIFLWSMSSLMIMSTVTVYHETVLHISKTKLGSIQGLANLSAFVSKFIFAIMVDLFHNFKSVLIFGSILTAMSKPLFGYAASYDSVFYLRSLERLIKGVRGAPTDSYISFVEEKEKSGQAFALKQVAITLGSIAGCLIASLFLFVTSNNFKLLFQLAAVPVILATLVLIFFLKNPPQFSMARKKRSKRFNISEIRHIPGMLWFVFFLVFGITLCRFGESFLGHRFFESGVSMHLLPLTYIYYDLPFALISFYMVRLFDTTDWRKIFLISILFLNVAYFCLFISNSYAVLILGSALGGLHMGTSQGLFLSMVSKYTPEEIRGTTFALLYTVMGIGLYASGRIAGGLSHMYGTWKAPFVGGFVITGFLCALVLLTIMAPRLNVFAQFFRKTTSKGFTKFK